jgi:transposase
MEILAKIAMVYECRSRLAILWGRAMLERGRDGSAVLGEEQIRLLTLVDIFEPLSREEIESIKWEHFNTTVERGLSAGEAEQRMDLTDEQWEVLEPLIPAPPQREDGRERPWRDPRDVLNAILWILRTGAPCKDLPERYPPYQSCHRRFQKWIEEGVLGSLLEALAKNLEERGERDRPLGCYT